MASENAGSPAACAMKGLPAHAEFDRYRLIGLLGHGGMGTVYAAHDLLLDRQVAVKFPLMERADEETRQRFLAEARAIARLSHPNVVSIHRVGEVAGRPYLVAELVRGEGLARLATPVAWPRVLEIGQGLTRGLAAAHARGVVHCDIKPANAILSEDGEVSSSTSGSPGSQMIARKTWRSRSAAR
jgi:serine/threonine protein kinase